MTQDTYFAYCRESIDLETGLQIQKEVIEKYAAYTGKTISKWFIDNDSSAYMFRPKYEKMMEAIKTAQEKGIICSNLSRFGRSTLDVLTEHKKLEDMDKELVIVKEQIDTTTPNGRLMFRMMAAFNDFEHDIIIERTHAGLEHAKKHGTKSGKPMHRPLKKIDWKQVDILLEKKIPVTNIAKIIGVAKKTMYSRLEKRRIENE